MNFVWLIAALILFYTANLAFATQENPIYAAKPHFPESINIQENTKFSVKVSNTGDSFLSDIKPIIEVNPKSASGFVHIQASPSVTALWGGYSDMIYGTIYVDKDIPVERIFVSVSFTAKNSRGEMIPLANPENNASIKIEKDSSDKNTDSIFDLEKEKPNCSNSKVSLYGCSDTTTVKIDSPLKQFKSGTPSQQVTCSEGLELVIKSSNGYPMCVKPPTKVKLIQKGSAELPIITEEGFVVSRPDLFLQRSLKIEGLNETQHVGQKIEFTVKFNGIKLHCSFYPRLHIENEEHETVWESNYILELCDPDITPAHFEKEWRIGSTSLGTPIINKTGSYTIFAEFENDIIQKDFRVNLEPQNSSREITILSVSPKNVTLPDNPKDKSKIISETKIPINKSKQIKITNNNSATGLTTHHAQVIIKSLSIDAKGNPPTKSGFDMWVFDYSIQNTDKSAHYTMLNFEVQFGQKTYSSELVGDEFYWMLFPDEKRDTSYAIQVSKGINQVILNVKDQTTKKILWSIPLDLTPYKIKYLTGYSNLIQE